MSVTIRVEFPSHFTVTMPAGSPVPRVGETFVHIEFLPPIYEGKITRHPRRTRRGVVARVEWEVSCRQGEAPSQDRVFAHVYLRRLPKT